MFGATRPVADKTRGCLGISSEDVADDDMNWSIGTFQVECAIAISGQDERYDDTEKKKLATQGQRQGLNTTHSSIDSNDVGIPKYVEYSVTYPAINVVDRRCGNNEIMRTHDTCDDDYNRGKCLNECLNGSKSGKSATASCHFGNGHFGNGKKTPNQERDLKGIGIFREADCLSVEEQDVQMILAENLLILQRLRPCLLRSSMSHEALRQWDKHLGLPASHSRTMLSSKRTRDQLQEGFDLLIEANLERWNIEGIQYVSKQFMTLENRLTD